MKTIILSMATLLGLVMASSVLAEDMPPLARENGCTMCHTVEKKLVGPAWRDVSKAYNIVGATGTAVNPEYQTTQKVSAILKEHNQKTVEAWLIEKVSKGGHGDWFTSTSMIPNSPRVSQENIKKLVDFILGLEKKK